MIVIDLPPLEPLPLEFGWKFRATAHQGSVHTGALTLRERHRQRGTRSPREEAQLPAKGHRLALKQWGFWLAENILLPPISASPWPAEFLYFGEREASRSGGCGRAREGIREGSVYIRGFSLSQGAFACRVSLGKRAAQSRRLINTPGLASPSCLSFLSPHLLFAFVLLGRIHIS